MGNFTGLPVQYVLGEDVPPDWKAEKCRKILLTWKEDGGQIIFQYNEGGVGPTPILDLRIRENCWMEIYLDEDKPWRWQLSYDAVTTKEERGDQYFALSYLDEHKNWQSREHFSEDDRVTALRFGARYNTDSPDDDHHAFCYNINLEYPRNTILSITIDPDIRNPGNNLD